MLLQAKANLGIKTNKALAEYLGISQPTLRRWEQNNCWPLEAQAKCGLVRVERLVK